MFAPAATLSYIRTKILLPRRTFDCAYDADSGASPHHKYADRSAKWSLKHRFLLNNFDFHQYYS